MMILITLLLFVEWINTVVIFINKHYVTGYRCFKISLYMYL